MTPRSVTPQLFLYQPHHKLQLYVSEVSSIQCLSLFADSASLAIQDFGATLLGSSGWATVEDLPEMNTVKDLLDFLNRKGELGLITLIAVIGESTQPDTVILETHDDLEAHLTFSNGSEMWNFLKRLLREQVPKDDQNLLIHALISNPGIYIRLKQDGLIEKYSSFEGYLQKFRG